MGLFQKKNYRSESLPRYSPKLEFKKVDTSCPEDMKVLGHKTNN